MSRQAFENWMTDEGKWPAAIEMADGNYKLSTASQSWKVWQAATAAALERAAEEIKKLDKRHWFSKQSDFAEFLVDAIRALKDAE